VGASVASSTTRSMQPPNSGTANAASTDVVLKPAASLSTIYSSDDVTSQDSSPAASPAPLPPTLPQPQLQQQPKHETHAAEQQVAQSNSNWEPPAQQIADAHISGCVQTTQEGITNSTSARCHPLQPHPPTTTPTAAHSSAGMDTSHQQQYSSRLADSHPHLQPATSPHTPLQAALAPPTQQPAIEALPPSMPPAVPPPQHYQQKQAHPHPQTHLPPQSQ
jgi:hypothetical protein